MLFQQLVISVIFNATPRYGSLCALERQRQDRPSHCRLRGKWTPFVSRT
jgi:hypothetical protein